MEPGQAKPRRKISIRRILTALACIFVLTAVIGELGVRYERVAVVQYLMQVNAKKPRLTALQDQARNPSKRLTTIEAYGWTLALPDAAIKTHREWKDEVFYQFDDGSSLIIIDQRSTRATLESTLQMWTAMGALRPAETSSLYAFQRAALTEDFRTPVHMWQSSRIMQRKIALATTEMMIPSDSSAVYDVTAGTSHGFECIRSVKSRTNFIVDLYDHLDNSIEIIYTSTQPHPQATLNSLLDSVQPPV